MARILYELMINGHSSARILDCDPKALMQEHELPVSEYDRPQLMRLRSCNWTPSSHECMLQAQGLYPGERTLATTLGLWWITDQWREIHIPSELFRTAKTMLITVRAVFRAGGDDE